MDQIKAKNLYNNLLHKSVNGFEITKLINNGKSAAVFEGVKNGKTFAVKVFDNELIENFGVEIQEARIKLELSLTDHKIPNLIKIVDGGNVRVETVDYYYLVMEYVCGSNLKDFIETETYDIDFIRKVTLTLLHVTEALLKQTPAIAHRDIKPENIMISSTEEVILMDLGVLKIVGAQTITDIGQKHFLGTLRYSAPEFLTRNEADTEDGWRAINFYQIGGVLHDLVMKKELFSGVEPYANLVIAIKDDLPKIHSDLYPGKLLQLARNLLIKDPKRRIELNSLDFVIQILEGNEEKLKDPESIFQSIKENTSGIRYELIDIENIQRSKEEKEKIKITINNNIVAMINQCLDKVSEYPMIKSLSKSGQFNVGSWKREDFKITNQIIQFDGNFDYGFVHPVCIFIRVDSNESSECSISMSGVILNGFNKVKINDGLKSLEALFSNKGQLSRTRQGQQFQVKYNTFFEGAFDSSDNELAALIETKLLLVLKKAIEYMKPEAEENIKRTKQHLERGSGISVYSSFKTVSPNYIIDKF